jgi:hypothetical protein
MEGDLATDDAAADTDTPPVDPDPLFVHGCPGEGEVVARAITDPGFAVVGPSGLGQAGDWLLMNDRAAFVIQDVAVPRTYWYYGGGLIDAVAVEGCRQLHPEQFEEAAMLVGRANITSFTDSLLRGFRGDRVEVIADGSAGGEARIRVHGTDDLFWLIELELVKRGFLAGSPRPVSGAMGLDIVVDYVLRPGSRVLEMEVTVRNLLDTVNPVLVGMVQFEADDTRRLYHASSQLSLGGIGADIGLPWLVSTSGTGAWAWGFEGWQVATTNISGVDAFLDVNTFLGPSRLEPAGSGEEDRYTTRILFAVGPTDAQSAIGELAAVLPEPIPEVTLAWGRVEGAVQEAGTGRRLAGVRVAVEAEGSTGWSPLSEMVTDAEGRFAGRVPGLDDGRGHRVRVIDPRFPTREPVAWTPGQDLTLPVELAPSGTLRWQTRNEEGDAMPAKLVLWQDGRMIRRLPSSGEPREVEVPPGRYEADITRGFEYEVIRRVVDIEAGGTVELEATLRRLVDTTGWLSMDGHVHAGPSPDSPVAVVDRILSLAVEGVEIAISTDHEILVDWQPGRLASGLSRWVNTVLGEEVTPPIPEHTNAWPFVADPDHPRGNPPDWRGLDMVQLHQAIRDRGAQVVSLNHPRLGCNWMCLIGYDRLTGEHAVQDPTLFGMAPGSALWSWDFDTIEYQNSNAPVFVDPAAPERTGLFEDWMSFHNLGYRITALGVTDVHGADAQGSPRNFFRAPTDEPAAFEDAMMVEAILQGRSLVSTGAFARVATPEGASLGDTVTLTDGTLTLDIEIQAIPDIDVTHFKVFANCDEVATLATTDPAAVLKFRDRIEIDLASDAHIVVMGFGRELLPRNLPQFDPTRVPRFTTNPIFVDVDGDGVFTPPGGRTCTYTLDPPASRKWFVDATSLRSRVLLSHLHAWNHWRTSALPEADTPRSPCLCRTGEDHDHAH